MSAPPLLVMAAALLLAAGAVWAVVRTQAPGIRHNVLALAVVMLSVVALIGGGILHVLDAPRSDAPAEAPAEPVPGVVAKAEAAALDAERRFRRDLVLALVGLGGAVVSALALAMGALLRGGNDAIEMARILAPRIDEAQIRRLEREAAQHEESQ